VQVGLVRDQTGWMLDILGDPARTGVVIVAAPEEMPVQETIELAGRLREETVVDLAGVVVNRVLPELFNEAEESLFEQLRDDEAAVAALAEHAGGPVGPILDAAQLAVNLRRSRAGHLQKLRTELPGVELLYVPYLFQRSHGVRATARIAGHLGEELGY
jgi:anion-transporting  ArsA/GET3 family ATPase